MERIPLTGPSITEREIQAVAEAAKEGWYENADLFQERFEKAFASYVGTRHAVSLPSCTSALHLSLLALNVGPGDEVIVPDITWIGSAAPISYVGATPVFADIDASSWCLSPSSFEACLTRKTKAVILVDLYGNMPEMDTLRDIAQKHGLAVVEDAAEAVGSEYRGKKSGAFGTTGVFSFHGSKLLTTGEGGMLVTDREDIYNRILFLRNHGHHPHEKMYWNTEVAYKYKMSALQAALGLAQLERIEELIEKKREIFGWYHEQLSSTEGLSFNREVSTVKNTFWMVTILLDPKFKIRKETFVERMGEQKIDCRPFFYPLSSLPAYQALSQAAQASKRNRVSYDLSPYGVNLPSGLNLTRENVGYVCDQIKKILRNKIP